MAFWDIVATLYKEFNNTVWNLAGSNFLYHVQAAVCSIAARDVRHHQLQCRVTVITNRNTMTIRQ